MSSTETFLRQTEFRKVNVQSVEIELELNEHIFPPSPNGSFYAESLRVNTGETVIDIGTGSGVLAIFAAKLGGIVSATDTSPYAIETARRNAVLNKVEIEFCQGTLFGDFDKNFDVIFANLPNEIVYEDYLKNVDAEVANTFEGGERGNKHILDLLKVASRHMHQKSRLYLPVHTLTDYHQTLRAAVSHYQTKLITVGELLTKDFVEKNIDFYLRLNEGGLIRIFMHEGKWYSNGYVYELSI